MNITSDGAGGFTIELKAVRTVSIKHIAQLRSYNIVQHEGLVVHAIEFLNGGTVSLKYENSGALVHFQLKHVSLLIKEGQDLVLSQQETGGVAQTS